MNALTEPGRGLRFDIYERIHLAEDSIGISELHEAELIPHIQVVKQDEQALLRGNLLLTGQYIGEDADDKRTLEHLIPVEITLPMSRIHRIEDILVEIENFDVELLSMRNLNVTGVLSLHGIELAATPERDAGATAASDTAATASVASFGGGEPVELNAPWVADEEVTFSYQQPASMRAEFETYSAQDLAAASPPNDEPGWGDKAYISQVPEPEQRAPIEPTFEPTFQPTFQPSFEPTFQSTFQPTYEPTFEPPTYASPYIQPTPYQAAPSHYADFRALYDQQEMLHLNSFEESNRQPLESNSEQSPDQSYAPSFNPYADQTNDLPYNPYNSGNDQRFDQHIQQSYEPIWQQPQYAPEPPQTTAYFADSDPFPETESAVQQQEEPKELRIAVGARKSDYDEPAAPQQEYGIKSLIRPGAANENQQPAADETNRHEGSRADALEWRKLFLREDGEQQQFRKVRMVIVQKEDSLDEIARRYGVQYRELQNYNKLGTDDVQTGQILYIPRA